MEIIFVGRRVCNLYYWELLNSSPSQVIEFRAAIKRQDVAPANILCNPKLKLFEIVWKLELLALFEDLKDRKSAEKTDVVLILSREEEEGKEEK